jgi:hypothetical protein
LSTLFAWPATAKVESRLARDRLLRAGGGGKAIRALYEAQVERIDWAFKLFTRSVNLPASGGVDEIEVFRITLRGDRTDDRVLAHIDKAVPHPILFELLRHAPDGDEVQLAAAYKRRSDADKLQVVTAEHWRGPWTPADQPRAALPQAASLEGLYAGLLRALWPHPQRGGESLREQAERLSRAASQGKAVERLRLAVRRESDFARKTELNRELRAAEAALKDLTEPA